MQVNNKIKAVVLFLGIVCVLYGTKRLYPPDPKPGSEEYMQMSGMFQTDITWPAEESGGGGFRGSRGFGKSY